MKFATILSFACFLLLALFEPSQGAPKKYMFVQAKCVEYPKARAEIGGPLSLCTFPPKHAQIPQEDIDAVIEHIKTLNLPN